MKIELNAEANLDFSSIANDVNRLSDKKMRRFRRNASSIVRGAFADVMSSEPRLAKYSDIQLDVDHRDISMPHVGQSLSIGPDTFGFISIIFSTGAMGKKGYYTLMAAQFGRDTSYGFFPMGVSNSTYRGKKLPKYDASKLRDPDNDMNQPYVIFVEELKAVEPWAPWWDDVIETSVSRLEEFVGSL